MIEQRIDDSTFLLLAMHAYDNSQCLSLSEFEEDLKRFSYLRKLFARYHNDKDLRERLILNHLIVLFNLFGIITIDFLFYKIDREYWSYLVTFLIYLDRMPDSVPEFGIRKESIPLDDNILKTLEKL